MVELLAATGMSTVPINSLHRKTENFRIYLPLGSLHKLRKHVFGIF
jgi:hypothetical protein